MAATKHKIRVSACAHVRNKILATRAPGSGDWLHTLPLSSIGLKMDNATVRIAVGLRLGAPIVIINYYYYYYYYFYENGKQ